jgi:hypothetical protein
LVGNPEGRDHLEDLGVDGKIILECIIGKYSGKVWTGCIWIRIETSGIKPLGSIKGEEFLGWQSEC